MQKLENCVGVLKLTFGATSKWSGAVTSWAWNHADRIGHIATVIGVFSVIFFGYFQWKQFEEEARVRAQSNRQLAIILNELATGLTLADQNASLKEERRTLETQILNSSDRLSNLNEMLAQTEVALDAAKAEIEKERTSLTSAREKIVDATIQLDQSRKKAVEGIFFVQMKTRLEGFEMSLHTHGQKIMPVFLYLPDTEFSERFGEDTRYVSGFASPESIMCTTLGNKKIKVSISRQVSNNHCPSEILDFFLEEFGEYILNERKVVELIKRSSRIEYLRENGIDPLVYVVRQKDVENEWDGFLNSVWQLSPMQINLTMEILEEAVSGAIDKECKKTFEHNTLGTCEFDLDNFHLRSALESLGKNAQEIFRAGLSDADTNELFDQVGNNFFSRWRAFAQEKMKEARLTFALAPDDNRLRADAVIPYWQRNSRRLSSYAKEFLESVSPTGERIQLMDDKFVTSGEYDQKIDEGILEILDTVLRSRMDEASFTPRHDRPVRKR
ncbi:MAG: hypothetical protein KF899_10470 [Parvibaculum sp.]|nr:hypothetical protein [Parvibaculum sp.]